MGLFSSLADSFSAPNPGQTAKVPLNDLQVGTGAAIGAGAGGIAGGASGSAILELDKLYQLVPTNWYTAKPYGFRFTMRSGRIFTMFLPISPSNINITTHFATNMISTLYGTVEEHSDVRYYDIVIEGTTGIAPQFTDVASSGVVDVAYANLKQPGRAKFPINSNVALGGFFSNTVSQVNNLLNQAGKAVSAVGGIFGASGQKPEAAVYTDQTGYTAFHNLYRFLLAYKKDAAGLTIDGQSNPVAYTTHPLTFFNYKDGNEYSVAVRNFVLRKSAENPMLYNYSIIMRAYNVVSSGKGLQQQENLTQRLQDLGLNGVKSSTLLTQIKNASNAAKATVGSAANGVNLFGR
jgi:hypothetical protein